MTAPQATQVQYVDIFPSRTSHILRPDTAGTVCGKPGWKKYARTAPGFPLCQRCKNGAAS